MIAPYQLTTSSSAPWGTVPPFHTPGAWVDELRAWAADAIEHDPDWAHYWLGWANEVERRYGEAQPN